MSAFQQAMANQNQPSGSSLSIRGASAAVPPTRTLSHALRSAGLSRDSRAEMDVDGGGGAGRPSRTGGSRGRGRSAGPLDQASRPRARNDAPYNRPPPNRPQGDRYDNNNNRNAGPSRSDPAPRGGLAGRLGGRGGGSGPRLSGNARRAPEGTPELFRTGDEAIDMRKQAANLSSKLRNDGMKAWLRSRVLGSGVMDMSKLPGDEYLKKENIIAPGHRKASPAVGAVFWKLIDMDVQKALGAPVHTLSLADNEFQDFTQLDRLPYCLPHLRALDLSNNPVHSVNELDVLLAKGEKKGNAMAGIGSLKSLIELKLNGCAFREKMLGEPKGDEKYQHEILRRFPGLLILDGVNLNRIIFPIERKPKVLIDEDVKRGYLARPLSFPMNVQGGFVDNEIVKGFVMSFCAKFFPLFDTNRNDLFPAYAPNATLSASVNTLRSRSHLSNKLNQNNIPAFTPWSDLPGRNIFRVSSVEQRLQTLKSPVDSEDLSAWWNRIPATQHPLEDPGKWCVDSWVLDGEGLNTKLCAMIQGEFKEKTGGAVRSFSRTFILADAAQGTPAQQAGWPCQVLSDTLIVHAYMTTEAFDNNRSVAVHGATIIPPQPIPLDQIPAEILHANVNGNVNPSVPAPAVESVAAVPNQDALIAQLRQATGMNVAFATLCMAQNGWDLETARRNFEEIKGTIPPEAFQ